MRPLFALLTLLAVLLYSPAAAAGPAEYHTVFACQKATDATGLLDLVEKNRRDDASKRFKQLIFSRTASCRVVQVGRVASFRVVKKYPPMLTMVEDGTVEAWVVKVRYKDGRQLYLILDRFEPLYTRRA